MIYFIIYFLLALTYAYAPYRVTGYFGKKLGRVVFSANPEDTYWKIRSHVKKRRILTVLALTTITLGSICLAVFIIVIYSGLHQTTDFRMTLLFVAAIIILSFLIYRIANTPRISPADTNHGNYYRLKNIVETLSITAGIEPPRIVLWSNNTPGIFMVVSTIKHAVLYITTGLLNNFSHSEIEACVAHEIGNYITHEVKMRKIVSSLLITLEISGLVSFILLLGILNPFLPFLWACILTVAAVNIYEYVSSVVNSTALFRMVFLVLNPVYLLAAFVSQLTYYTNRYGETLYADLKAIELTRYPQGMYSALAKIKFFNEKEDPLPSIYAPFFLGGELIAATDIPFTRSLVEEREFLIKSLDSSVTEKFSPDDPLHCGVCGKELKTIKADGLHRLNISVEACDNCGSLWFDDGEIYTLSSSDTKGYFNEYAKQSAKSHKTGPYSCPRCVVTINELSDINIPKDIKIYHCFGCGGDLVSTSDFFRYIDYRKNK